MLVFDKVEIRKSLTIDQIYSFLSEWGGDPEYTNFGILSATICHNEPGMGSRKLYYYQQNQMFHCYTGGCENATFDIFELYIKISNIQNKKSIDLNQAVRYIANKVGISGEYQLEEELSLEDWRLFSNYEKLQEINHTLNVINLKNYNSDILNRFNYEVKIQPWIDEGISEEVLALANIGYYPGGEQITIPHYDKDGNFIGLRGRTLCEEDSKYFGKYRPIRVNQTLYNHALGLNLYGLNWAKENIKLFNKVIIVESEKSVLKYMSYFGIDKNICVACCGSNISLNQINLLEGLNVNEIIIGFDRQFQQIGDDEHKKLKNNLLKIRSRFKNSNNISFIFDKNMLTDYKSSPLDHGPEVFLKLFKERIVL